MATAMQVTAEALGNQMNNRNNGNNGVKGSETLIRGNCEVAGKLLNALFNSRTKHSFIAFDKASELGLKIMVLGYDLKVHNATSEAVVTRLGCPQVSFRVKQRDFIHDLICLPMTGLDIILELDWLSKNCIFLNYSERTLHFMSEGSEGPVVVKDYYLNSVVVNCSGCECKGIILLAANVSDEEQSLEQILVVCKFSKVFSDDIPKFPPAREIKFAIELVPGAGPISIAPYQMSSLELTELKSQLEELMSKSFIRSSVSPRGAPVLLLNKVTVKNKYLLQRIDDLMDQLQGA
ncbi:uncharacterized protein LOC107484880 [Arachis duranensis]|uniref:Uncharacterized protein LOC107484880 n=1 Tax=Arachis duranensis TaxID=130453 RepID=A0A6P4D1L3_ARADU|nr:uncharacterized protein LOC107484880 [Arachis duranensis]